MKKKKNTKNLASNIKSNKFIMTMYEIQKLQKLENLIVANILKISTCWIIIKSPFYMDPYLFDIRVLEFFPVHGGDLQNKIY